MGAVLVITIVERLLITRDYGMKWRHVIIGYYPFE